VRFTLALTFLAAAGAALLLSGCGQRDEPTGPIAAPFPVTVEGVGDEATILEAAPDRVVALAPGAAELVDALGAGGSLVGVPAGVRLTSGGVPEAVVDEDGAIDVDAVVELEPDLVIVTPETDRVDAAQVARRTGAPVYVQPALAVDDVPRAVLDLGFLLGRPVEARKLAAELRADVAEVEQRLSGVEPVTTFVDTGLFVTIRDPSFFADLIRRAGGVNVAPDPSAGPPTPEELSARDPDVYLATSDSDRTLESLQANPDTRDLRAVRDGRVVIVPLDLVTRAGPRVAEALETIALALHPEAFR
jgi:iron complex transport system substrate-binding protein